MQRSYMTRVFALFCRFGCWIARRERGSCKADLPKKEISLALWSETGHESPGMLFRLLELDRATVEDLMIPKVDIVGIDLEQSGQQLLEQLKSVQYTRLPLYHHSIDNIVGIVHLRDILQLLLDEHLDKNNLLEIAEAPYFIPEATALNVQLIAFQRMKRHSCFVVDEYGNLQGLLSLNDIFEEILSRFTKDSSDLSHDIIPQNDGSLIVDASITLLHLQRLLGWQFPSMGPRTLSGLIIEYLGYIPPADCCLSIADHRIEILKVGANTIKTVRMLN